MSVKARAAIMLAGHRADAVLFQDEATGEWLTSSAYGSEFPVFGREFLSANPITADFSSAWTLSAPLTSYTGGRSVLGEGPPTGWTTSFPHEFAAGEPTPGDAFFRRWRTSPFADAYYGRFATAAVDSLKLGSGPGVDFLSIGFSATDYVGHSFGPDSLEIEDHLIRLDQTIGTLLDKLDSSVGAGNYVVALTADHGVAAVPEQAKERGQNAGRVDPRRIVERVENALSEKLGAGKHVAQMIGSDLYLALGVADRLREDESLWRYVREAALAEPGVDRVVLSTKLDSGVSAALQRAMSFDQYPGRSGDLWIGLRANWIFSARTETGWARGTTHGSVHNHDQRVPIILFGAGIKPGRYDDAATPADIAPTLASLVGIPIARTDGRILHEALAEPASEPSR
jgi:hypothetical protein